MSHENIIAILSILISAIVAVTGFVIARQTEKLRAMREQLSEKKCKAYADAMMIFYSILKDSQLHRPTDNKAMMQKMIDTKKDIFMYGSDKVFRSFNKWLVVAFENNNKNPFDAFMEFVLEMRKDIFNGKTKQEATEFISKYIEDLKFECELEAIVFESEHGDWGCRD